MPDWMIAIWDVLQDPNKLAASQFLWAILVAIVGALFVVLRLIFKKKPDQTPNPNNSASNGGVVNIGKARDITTNSKDR